MTAPDPGTPRATAVAALATLPAPAALYRAEIIAVAQVHALLHIGDALHRLADTQHPNPWETT